jgi:hypothetical protein
VTKKAPKKKSYKSIKIRKKIIIRKKTKIRKIKKIKNKIKNLEIFFLKKR